MYQQEIVADHSAGIFSVNLFRLLFIKKHSELLIFKKNKCKIIFIRLLYAFAKFLNLAEILSIVK